MNQLHFSDNIIKLRHQKKITQEQLASFIGVTKASVSKWETKQSLPDILLLPHLAAFFNTTIDYLLGYKPQLSKEQIQKLYHELADDFAKKSFAETFQKSQELMKKYYSCYPFLLQICILWLNHFMLLEDKEQQLKILSDISDLCCHIISNCKDIGICEDATIIKASVDLQLGKVEDVIDILEDILNPRRLSTQSDSLLIQAYLLANKKEQADSFTQISMFLHLLSILNSATQYLIIHSEHLEICEETIQRINNIISTYQLDYLHTATALFYYQAAIIYCMHKKKQNAFHMLERYTTNINYFLTDNHFSLHGDDYFYDIQPWYEQLELGADPPRNKQSIFESFKSSLEHPAFAYLSDCDEFKKLKRKVDFYEYP